MDISEDQKRWTVGLQQTCAKNSSFCGTVFADRVPELEIQP